MYKAAARWMIRRSIRRMNEGDYRPTLAMYAEDATLTFPGDNSWSRQYREPRTGRASSPTHRGRAEIEHFLQRCVDHGLQIEAEDILVNGPPWNTRAAVIARSWMVDDDGTDAYANRAVLVVRSRWGKIHTHEDFEDTERVAAFDARQAQRTPVGFQNRCLSDRK